MKKNKIDLQPYNAREFTTLKRKFLEGCVLIDPIVKYTRPRTVFLGDYFAGDWANYSTADKHRLRISTTPGGFAIIEGYITKPTSYTAWSAVFTLPEEFRPKITFYWHFSDSLGNTFGYAQVGIDGKMSFSKSISSTPVYFAIHIPYYLGV